MFLSWKGLIQARKCLDLRAATSSRRERAVEKACFSDGQAWFKLGNVLIWGLQLQEGEKEQLKKHVSQMGRHASSQEMSRPEGCDEIENSLHHFVLPFETPPLYICITDLFQVNFHDFLFDATHWMNGGGKWMKLLTFLPMGLGSACGKFSKQWRKSVLSKSFKKSMIWTPKKNNTWNKTTNKSHHMLISWRGNDLQNPYYYLSLKPVIMAVWVHHLLVSCTSAHWVFQLAEMCLWAIVNMCFIQW